MNDNQQKEQLSSKESYELRHRQKLIEQKKLERRRFLRKFLKIGLPAILIVGGIIWLVWYVKTLPPTPAGEVISYNGIHWHPNLAIYIKGQKQEIPANIGINPSFHSPIHTHDADGVLHMEMQGVITKKDTTLGRFFEIWGKKFASMGTATMLVNGIENKEFENYKMKDGDKIEIRYE